jgi:hypothetical protein
MVIDIITFILLVQLRFKKMATSYKVLGQINPAGNTLTNVYVVPTYYTSVVSSLLICNQKSTNALVSIAVQPNGNTIATKHYLVYNALVQANDTIPYTIGITLNAGDILSANTNSANISITAFGMQTDSIKP